MVPASQPVEALLVDDTGFPKDGAASPCVARQYSGTLGKIGNCQIGVSVHLVYEHASCAASWRLFCPESWDDAALAHPVATARPPAGGSGRSSRAMCAVPGLALLVLVPCRQVTGRIWAAWAMASWRRFAGGPG